jgi:hypothetical protein
VNVTSSRVRIILSILLNIQLKKQDKTTTKKTLQYFFADPQYSKTNKTNVDGFLFLKNLSRIFQFIKSEKKANRQSLHRDPSRQEQ